MVSDALDKGGYLFASGAISSPSKGLAKGNEHGVVKGAPLTWVSKERRLPISASKLRVLTNQIYQYLTHISAFFAFRSSVTTADLLSTLGSSFST